MLKFKYVSQGSLKTLCSAADPITTRSLRLNQLFQVKQTCSLTYGLFQTLKNSFEVAGVTAFRPWRPLPLPVFVCCLQGRVSLCGQQGGGCSLGREEFLEALLQLYQECTSPELMKIHHVAKFVKKCKHHFHSCVKSLILSCARVSNQLLDFLIFLKCVDLYCSRLSEGFVYLKLSCFFFIFCPALTLDHDWVQVLKKTSRIKVRLKKLSLACEHLIWNNSFSGMMPTQIFFRIQVVQFNKV